MLIACSDGPDLHLITFIIDTVAGIVKPIQLTSLVLGAVFKD